MAGSESKIEMAKIGNLAFLMVTLSAPQRLGNPSLDHWSASSDIVDEGVIG